MAQWHGTDANRVRQIGLINSSPSLGAVLRHHPSPAGSSSRCANRQWEQGQAPGSLRALTVQDGGKPQRFHLRYQQAAKIKDQSQQHRGSCGPSSWAGGQVGSKKLNLGTARSRN